MRSRELQEEEIAMGFADEAPATRGGFWFDLALRLLVLTLAAGWLLLPPGRVSEPSPPSQAVAASR
ncbi:MAG: hypothetical protein DI527_10255 [Chelatococcus sp.]|nr:MAG: hypothetical protein DI527_10255 [Chelatococcus sp.]